MKRDYMALCGILAAAFVLFFALSLIGDVDLGFCTIKGNGLARAFIAAQDTPSPICESGNIDCDVEGDGRVYLDTSGKTVLLIGDSMLEGLSPRLGAYCEASGHKLYTVIWYGSTTELFSKSHFMAHYIAKLSPNFIFLSLGGNELFIRDISNTHIHHVRNIIAEIDTIPYLWIGPPNWRNDTGINSLIKDNVRSGTFFTSRGMQFDRKSDGVHPTNTSAALWMDSIIHWMPDSAAFVIPFKQPEKQSMRAERIYVHNPGMPVLNPK